MQYTDKVLIELNKFIPDKLYLGPKVTSRIVCGRNIKNYDILISRDSLQSIPDAIIYREIDKDRLSIRMLGVKILVTILDYNIEAFLLKQSITVESMSLKVTNGFVNTGDIIDPYKVKNQVVRGYVGFNKNIKYDLIGYASLKILEYMAMCKLKMTTSTKKIIRKNTGLIEELDRGVIKEILFNILECKKSSYYLNYMDEELNILNRIIPEVDTLKNVGQCKYHVVDTWTHSINTMREIENIIYADGYFENHLRRAYELHSGTIIGSYDRVKLLKLGALFHDIGKPRARWTDSTGRDRFRGHEVIGGEMVEEICSRLNFNKAEIDYLKKLVVNHMVTLVLYKTNDVSANSLFDIFEKLGEDTMDVILIGLADIISTRRLLKPYEEMSIYKIHAEYLVNNYLIRYRKVLSLGEIISISDVVNLLNCTEDQAKEYLLNVRRGLFNGEIYLNSEKIKEYLKNRSKA